MNRFVWVTTELYPGTTGGAGVVVDSLSSELAPTNECSVLLMTSNEVEVSPHRGVDVETFEIPKAGFLDRSQAVAEAIASAVRPGDRIEIQDFEGLGFWALTHRSEYGLEHIPITVRLHGPYDLLAEAMDSVPKDWSQPRVMEAEVFKMADRVLIPVPGHLHTLVERYGVEEARIAVSPPFIAPIDRVSPTQAAVPTFAVIGRLGEMKGSQDMVAASMRAIAAGADLRVRFIGDDGWSPSSGTWMKDRLRPSIGPEHESRFEFAPSVKRMDLPSLLGDVTAVVIPSRFETFCLVAHEARRMGLPVIVPDIDAFRGLFSPDTGASMYDGTVDGLSRALRLLATNPDLVASMAAHPIPEVGDPLAAYQIPPPVRHARSQAGLATAAMQRFEEATSHKPARSGSSLQKLYELIPSGLATGLAKALPQSVKARAKKKASWPEEQARRSKQDRLARIESRIESGNFQDVDDPAITVVIPVFNDSRFLDDALASVYEQSFDSWEIVIVDDGSSNPETIEYLNRLKQPRVKLITQSNKGLPAARNAGIRIARGEFIIPLDSDDELAPLFMERTFEEMRKNERAAFAHCYARLHHDIDAVWITRPFNPYWQLLGNGVVGCVLLRKEALQQAGGYDETMTGGNEDWELWIRLFRAGWSQIQIPEVLFKYRKHGISMSVDTESRFEEGRRMVRDRHRSLYENSALATTKQTWYPMLTAIADTDRPPVEDVEWITSVDALTSTWGKYVVDVRGLAEIPIQTALELADQLEADPGASSIVTSGSPPLVVMRRWNLHDTAAPAARILESPDKTPGGGNELPRFVERSGWSATSSLQDVPIQRQAPEESGRLPDAGTW